MSNRFLTWLDSIGRKRIILDRDSKDPYLERYYLFLKDRQKFPFNVFLHKFLRSDPDDLHDHPWPYFTLILKGGYWEWIPIMDKSTNYTDPTVSPPEPVKIIGERRVWRGAGHFRVCKSTSFHRIEVEPGVDCWTLFMPGPQTREWGFLTHNNWLQDTFKWIKHDRYIAGRNISKT